MLGPSHPRHDRDADRQVGSTATPGSPRRPRAATQILLAALLATLAAACSGGGARTNEPVQPGIAKGQPAPAIVGTTLAGAAFSLADLRGRSVVVNFWGPSCVPCREEFPLLEGKLAQHAAEGIAIVGVLTDDPPEPARQFVTDFKATWPTVIDPDKAIKTAYRVAARPQTYFIDRQGIVRIIQVGQLTDADFEREYALIAK